LVIAAIAEEIEKKTSGTIVVNRRLRKISPNGLRTAALCFNTIPRRAPIRREQIKMMEKPYDVKNGGNLIFIFFSVNREIEMRWAGASLSHILRTVPSALRQFCLRRRNIYPATLLIYDC
jgi:hypothetical protein